jgi:predicted DCC family thiol-disulfide oxidoreductase YuxK
VTRPADLTPNPPALGTAAGGMEAHGIVIFDGVCNLCSASAQFIVRNDRRHAFMLASAQSAAGRQLLVNNGFDPGQLDTFVLLTDGKLFVRSDAALRIAQELDWPWRALALLRMVPRFLRNALYDLVARNRYRWFGKKNQCMIPSAAIKARFLE